MVWPAAAATVDVRPAGSIPLAKPDTIDPDCERGRVVDDAILGRPLVGFRELLLGAPEVRFLQITYECDHMVQVRNHTSS